MYCYKCKNIETHRILLKGMLVEKCSKCQGVFLDKGEFEAIKANKPIVMEDVWLQEQIDQLRDKNRKAHTPKYNICPSCNEAVFPIKIEDLELDMCCGCSGTFYDAGELEYHLSIHKPEEAVNLLERLFKTAISFFTTKGAKPDDR